MDPGQDLLLAALSESGICPNDISLFDVDSQDVAQPSTNQQVRQYIVFVFMMWMQFNNVFHFTLMLCVCSSSLSPSVPWMLVLGQRQWKLCELSHHPQYL